MLSCEVCVHHRGPEIAVAYRLFHVHGVLTFCQPCGYPTVPEVVLNEVGRKLGPLGRRFERIVQRPDPFTDLVVPA